MACTPQQIKHTRQNWQAPNFTSMDGARIHISYYVNFGACQSWRPCSIHILTTPFFWAQSAPSGIIRVGSNNLFICSGSVAKLGIGYTKQKWNWSTMGSQSQAHRSANLSALLPSLFLAPWLLHLCVRLAFKILVFFTCGGGLCGIGNLLWILNSCAC
jgi:hypothetical protein